MDGLEGSGGRTSPTAGGDLAAGDYVAFGAPDPPALPPPPPPPVANDIPVSRSWRREEGADDDAIEEMLDGKGGEKSPIDDTLDKIEENISNNTNATKEDAVLKEDSVDLAPRANGLAKQAALGEHEHSSEGCATECLFCTVACCDYCVIM